MVRLRLLMAAVALVLGAAAGLGQESGGVSGQPPAAKGAPSLKPPPAKGGSATSDELRQRVEQLEAQLIDMQVILGTLESLARSPPSAAPGGRSGGASDDARLDGIETQVRALTAQIEQLSGQVQQGGSGSRSGSADGRTSGFVAQRDSTAPRAQAPDETAGGFGSTTVTPDAPRGSGDVARAPDAAGGQSGTQGGFEDLPPAAGEGGSNPKELYEKAYGYLLQQNYPAAEQSFDEFLKRYPNDSLSGNAQYWLGESHFVRGEYKAAASAFLKGYETYAKSAKAPDSLLKLAMSLDRLGQKDAACSSYSELSSRFPNAAASVKSRAQSEKQRVGCP